MNGEPQQWDAARPLVYGALLFLGSAITFVFGVAAYQIWMGNGPSTEVWAAITGIIGFVTGLVANIFAFRFGSSKSSAIKNDTIREMSKR